MQPRSLAVLLAAGLAGCGQGDRGDARVLRVGYFPNITHAQALIGLARGDFQQALGTGVKIKPFVFNAGPSVIEALFAGELDVSYIGPGPAVNGYVKSNGQALRIIAGAASGGAVLVARSDAAIQSPQDWLGKRIASPQLGNTQDIALRHYLQQHGVALSDRGGSVTIAPMQNADILTAFLRKEVDAAWVPEPWGSRLVHEAQGRIILDERDLWPGGTFASAVVIAGTKTLRERPELVRRWLAAHAELTDWIRANPKEAKRLVNQEIARHVGKPLPDAVLNDAWSRFEVTADPMKEEILLAADHAFALGFLGTEKPDLSGLFEDLR